MMSKFSCEKAIIYEQMFVYFAELTPDQQKILIDIRRRKTELLLEIQVSVFLLFVCKELGLIIS